jgi:hypothetical protein
MAKEAHAVDIEPMEEEKSEEKVENNCLFHVTECLCTGIIIFAEILCMVLFSFLVLFLLIVLIHL